ncbi:unnamed protein product [Brassica rapa subsp. trilocularis]
MVNIFNQVPSSSSLFFFWVARFWTWSDCDIWSWSDYDASILFFLFLFKQIRKPIVLHLHSYYRGN